MYHRDQRQVNGKNCCLNHMFEEQSYFGYEYGCFLFVVILNLAKLPNAIFFSFSLTSEKLYLKAYRNVLPSVVLSPLSKGKK